jgi:hypothetical protein
MQDWLGLGFFILLLVAGYFGLKSLGNQPRRSEEDFENRASDGTGTLSAGVGALNELLNPNEAKAKEVKVQLKEGRFDNKKREGKGEGGMEH